MNPITFIAAVLLLATFVEGTVEYFLSDVARLKPYLKYVALVLGVLVALGYKIDIFGAVGLISPVPFLGAIISGIIIGRGSNYANDLISRLRGDIPPVKEVVVAVPATPAV